MLNLNELRRGAERVLEERQRGYTELPMKTALADLAVPLLQLIEAMEADMGDSWLLLSEVKEATGWSDKYFRKRQTSLGGKSRLEVWEKQGGARKVTNGPWLISPLVVPDRKSGYTPPAGAVGVPAPKNGGGNAGTASDRDPTPDPHAIANKLMNQGG